MNESKLSINRACAVGAVFLGLLSAVTVTAAFLLTGKQAIAWLGLLFILLVFICVALFVAFLRRKLVLFSDAGCLQKFLTLFFCHRLFKQSGVYHLKICNRRFHLMGDVRNQFLQISPLFRYTFSIFSHNFI